MNTFQTADRAGIRDERRRLARTRRLLQAQLERDTGDWPATLSFVEACVAFLEVSTKRLIAQDISLAQQLRPTLPRERADDHAFLNELEERLTQRRKELADLVRATVTLARIGAAGLETFRTAVDLYFAAPATARSRPMHSLPPLIEAYGSPDSWANAQAAADACGSELEAYKVVEARTPPGLLEIVLERERQEPSQRPQPA